MGGQNSQVLDSTTTVFLEAAGFERIGIRKTAKRLNLRSESSLRFEKGCDVIRLPEALDRAAYLLQEYADGQVVGSVCDVYPQPQDLRVIKLRPARVNLILGLELSAGEISDCLSRLGIETEADGDSLIARAPSYRPDLEAEVDLIEEVARIYGYNRIPMTFPSGRITPGGMNDYQLFRDSLRNFLAQNLLEVVTYSFISPRAFDQLGLPEDSPLRNVVRIANPLSEEQSVMRTSLLPGLLETAARNLARQNQGIAFFEMGHLFQPTADSVEEKIGLAGIVSGNTKHNWLKNYLKMDFYYCKGILDSLFRHLGIQAEYSDAEAPGYYHPGCTALVSCNGVKLGYAGVVHPEVLKRWGWKEQACIFEFDVEQLYALADRNKTTRSFSRFPAVERDLAILVELSVQAKDITDAIQQEAIPDLNEINIFDVYAGEQVPSGYKSVAINFVFQSHEQTLTEKEIADAMGKISARLAERLAAKIRA
jgi:phenylalanyl-tRNA synthetase beta chain